METYIVEKPRFSPCSYTWRINNQRHFSFWRNERMPVRDFQELRDKTTLLYPYDIAWYKVSPHIRTLEAFLNREVYFAMPRNSKEPINGWQFATITLTAADESKFTDWYASNINNIIELTSECVGEGYKLSATYDVNNTCYIVTLSGTDNSPRNRGVSMSARSDDFYEALALLLYKHYVMCEQSDWLNYTRRSNWG